jgi:hypothetical protein
MYFFSPPLEICFSPELRSHYPEKCNNNVGFFHFDKISVKTRFPTRGWYSTREIVGVHQEERGKRRGW